VTMNRIFILFIIFTTFIFVACSDFEQKAKPLYQDIEKLYDISLKKCKITQEVWKTAIYDKRYALSTSNKFDDYYTRDFNTALLRMENDHSIKQINDSIIKLRESIVRQMENIKDRSGESYNQLVNLYSNTIEISKSAIEPTGSLQSFSNDIQEKEKQINLLITEFGARHPEFNK